MTMHAYLRLMRFHKPVGSLLLWFPTAWALWLANQGHPPVLLTVYFMLGTIIMRSAGCVINDMADRRIDCHVQRTLMRPLATGELRMVHALGLLGGLFLAALLVVMQLPRVCFYEALGALIVTAVYPFCKRFLSAPQLVLGVAFSMGIPMAYTASGVALDRWMWVLFGLNFLWIVAYDTMYAMIDRDDDLRIGVKSTAVLFASNDRVIIAGLQVVFHGLWLLLAVMQGYSMFFYVGWMGAIFLLVYQQHLLHRNASGDEWRAFSWNAWYGLWMWLLLMMQ